MGADGTTIIANAAREPEIVDLQGFLRNMGAQVQGAGSSTVVVEGGAPLHGGGYAVMGDRIVAATYLAAAAGTGGDGGSGVDYRHLSTVAPCCVRRDAASPAARPPSACRPPAGVRPIRTAPYPGFPTDAQALLMASR